MAAAEVGEAAGFAHGGFGCSSPDTPAHTGVLQQVAFGGAEPVPVGGGVLGRVPA